MRCEAQGVRFVLILGGVPELTCLWGYIIRFICAIHTGCPPRQSWAYLPGRVKIVKIRCFDVFFGII